MTGPRIYPDNTAVSPTPRPTKGLGDLLKKILYDNPKANIASLRDPVDPATIDEFLMQAAMGSVGSMDKVGGKVGEGLKKVLGVSGKEPLGMPDYISGPRGLARGLSPLARAALQRDEALAQLEKSDLPEVLRLRSEAGIHTLYEQLVAKINALNVKFTP